MATTKLKCQGVLINSHTLLTAAHCINDPVDTLDINVPDPAKNDDFSKRYGLIYSAQSITIVDGYDPSTRVNDLAILKIHPFKNFFTPIQVPEFSFDEADEFGKPGTTLSSVGYKCDPSNNIESIDFNTVTLTSQPNETCSNWTQRGYSLSDANICTQQPAQGVNCNDEGGPLLYSKDGKNYLVGINKILSKDSATTMPSVFTKLSPFIPVIKKLMEPIPN
ncbi:trypsin-like serine protease [Conidiobolus coronatus NRRL 28638]|uniref:Trypsin-like serine protease n=1 Tax=Conidiobolus coronatus (strain ATCC 28846 / CBS 209.66 / NRRL 28638) TaxID=796925 RepID=A0A137NZU4_CONC2|nr:trypsin-like serine protease [Conidiobolus coronatus NRRL 28638]|eukprot:KXN68262.1 trypsin-like serine protease [Conidiobolus coronatus NRRL 28638]